MTYLLTNKMMGKEGKKKKRAIQVLIRGIPEEGIDFVVGKRPDQSNFKPERGGGRSAFNTWRLKHVGSW